MPKKSMSKKSMSYRNNVTVSDAFYAVKVLLGVIISLLLTIIGIINYQNQHTTMLLWFTLISAIICIILIFRFLWCYYALQKGKHVGKDIGHA